jgi:hypothetical protein
MPAALVSCQQIRILTAGWHTKLHVISQSFYDQLNFIIKMNASRVYLLTKKQYARRFAFLGLVATCGFTGI